LQKKSLLQSPQPPTPSAPHAPEENAFRVDGTPLLVSRVSPFQDHERVHDRGQRLLPEAFFRFPLLEFDARLAKYIHDQGWEKVE
jgi:hypothetical protein